MMKSLILAARPKTLPASLGPVILGLSLASFLGTTINKTAAALTILCALLLQISTNYVNDYFDGLRGIDTEDRIGPKRLLASGELNTKQLKLAFMTTLGIAFILGIYLMILAGMPIVIIGISSIVFAYAYTGGPFPLSYYALGEVLALIFFGPIAVWGTYYIQAQDYNLLPAYIGLGPGLISAAIMGINNLRDRQSDMKTKKTTLAIILGENLGRVFILTMVILSSFIPITHILWYQGPQVIIITTFIIYFFLKTWLAIGSQEVSKKFNVYLANTGKYLFFFCITYSLALFYAR